MKKTNNKKEPSLEASAKAEMESLAQRERDEKMFWKQFLVKLMHRDVARQLQPIGSSNAIVLSAEEFDRMDKEAYEKWSQELNEYGIYRFDVNSEAWPSGHGPSNENGLLPVEPFPSFKGRPRN